MRFKKRIYHTKLLVLICLLLSLLNKSFLGAQEDSPVKTLLSSKALIDFHTQQESRFKPYPDNPEELNEQITNLTKAIHQLEELTPPLYQDPEILTQINASRQALALIQYALNFKAASENENRELKAKHQIEIAQYEAQKNADQITIANLKDQTERLLSHNRSLEADATTPIQALYDSYKTTLQGTHKQELELKAAEYRNLQAQYETLKTQLIDTQKTCDNLRTQKEALQTQLNEKTLDCDNLRTQKEVLQRQFNEKTSDCANLQTAKDLAQKELTAIFQKYTVVSNRNGELETAFTTCQSDRHNLQIANELVQTRFENITNQYYNLNIEYESLRQQLNSPNPPSPISTTVDRNQHLKDIQLLLKAYNQTIRDIYNRQNLHMSNLLTVAQRQHQQTEQDLFNRYQAAIAQIQTQTDQIIRTKEQQLITQNNKHYQTEKDLFNRYQAAIAQIQTAKDQIIRAKEQQLITEAAQYREEKARLLEQCSLKIQEILNQNIQIKNDFIGMWQKAENTESELKFLSQTGNTKQTNYQFLQLNNELRAKTEANNTLQNQIEALENRLRSDEEHIESERNRKLTTQNTSLEANNRYLLKMYQFVLKINEFQSQIIRASKALIIHFSNLAVKRHETIELLSQYISFNIQPPKQTSPPITTNPTKS